jgi:hypothetical protein
MSAGITRVHGSAGTPSQRPSYISFYTATWPSVDIHTSEVNVVNGVFDQVFRTAVDQFATVAMIGTPAYAASNTTIRFAIEDTGVDANSPTGLGLGSSEGNSYGTTALALQAAIRALGATVGPNSVDCTGVTVAGFTL